MAKERKSAAFQGLLAGVDFMKGLQRNRKEEDRYQDQVAFRDKEFDFRKAQAKLKANQWRRTFAENVRQFNEGDKNADADRVLKGKQVDALTGYYEGSIGVQNKKLDLALRNLNRADKLDEENRQMNNLLNEIARNSQAPKQVTPDEVASTVPKEGDPDYGLPGIGKTALKLGGKALDLLGLNPQTNAHEEKIERTTAELNASSFATTLVERQIPTIEKTIAEANKMTSGDALLKTSPQMNKVIADVDKAIRYVNEGLITDPELVKKIQSLSKLVLPYSGAYAPPNPAKQKAEYDIQKAINIYQGKKEIDRMYEEE